MNEKIKEILDRLFVYKNENDEMKYQPEDILTIDDVWLLLDYITNLQEKVNQYENPDDLTLFYMWLDEKAKDKMKKLQEESEELKAELEMYENGVYFSSENDELQQRINTAIAYIECGKTFDDIEVARIIDKYEKTLLEILQGSEKE